MTVQDVISRASAIEDQIIGWRRDIHKYPELGFNEYRTARLVADTLSTLGMEVMTGVGKTGVVGILGEGSPVIGIRADMDALPIQEENDVEYASRTPGNMHACGHDSHTAMLLGAARILSQMPDRPAGQIRFFFQPCEETTDAEGKSGAQRMIEDGALEGVDHVIALHVASDLPAGMIVVNDGALTAAVDDFEAVIVGKGCHGAYPHRGVDPIFMLAQVINAVQGIRARRVNPVQTAVVTIGTVHGGTAPNIIPGEVTITGTLRSHHAAVREQLWEELETALSITRSLGGDYRLNLKKGCPSVINDEHVTSVVRAAASEVVGADQIVRLPPNMGGEDFSYMTNAAPGAMFLLGAKRDEIDRPHHNARFDLDESVFKTGTAILTETACRLLEQTGQ